MTSRRDLLKSSAVLPLLALVPRFDTSGFDTIAVALLRHAEKSTPDPKDPKADDPPLTAAGEARAQRLASLLAAAPLGGVYATQLRRTVDTVEPLAKARGVEVAKIDAQNRDELMKRIKGTPRATLAVVAGHSNTIPQLAKELGATIGDLDDKGNLKDDRFDRLFLLVLGRNGSALRLLFETELRTG